MIRRKWTATWQDKITLRLSLDGCLSLFWHLLHLIFLYCSFTLHPDSRLPVADVDIAPRMVQRNPDQILRQSSSLDPAVAPGG